MIGNPFGQSNGIFQHQKAGCHAWIVTAAGVVSAIKLWVQPVGSSRVHACRGSTRSSDIFVPLALQLPQAAIGNLANALRERARETVNFLVRRRKAQTQQ